MKRDDVERAVDEELSGSFYHVSDEPLLVGATLGSRGSRGLTPQIVDRVRPRSVAPRNKHLFMLKDLDCASELGQDTSIEYVYRVTPTTPVVKTDYEWLVQARQADLLGNASRARKLARRYWSGEPVSETWPCSTEYLTEAFRVDELLSAPTR